MRLLLDKNGVFMRKELMDLPLWIGTERKLYPMRSKSRGIIIALGVNSSLFFSTYESDLIIYFNMLLLLLLLLLLSMVERKKEPLQPSSLIFQRKSSIDNTYALFGNNYRIYSRISRPAYKSNWKNISQNMSKIGKNLNF